MPSVRNVRRGFAADEVSGDLSFFVLVETEGGD